MLNPLIQLTQIVLEGNVKTSHPLTVCYTSVEAASDFRVYVPTVSADWIIVKETNAEIRKLLDDKYAESTGPAGDE